MTYKGALSQIARLTPNRAPGAQATQSQGRASCGRLDIARRRDASDPIQQRLHDTSGGIERVYGGQEASTPQEMQLVQAWRPAPDGSWTLGQGSAGRAARKWLGRARHFGIAEGGKRGRLAHLLVGLITGLSLEKRGQ